MVADTPKRIERHFATLTLAAFAGMTDRRKSWAASPPTFVGL